MGKILERKIENFSDGMKPYIRANTGGCALSSGFTPFRTGVLSPNLAYTTFTDNSEKVVKFAYAKKLDGATVTYYVYGLGDDGTGKPKIFMSQVSTTPSWTAIATCTTGAKNENVFFEYKDDLYFWQNGTVLSQLKDLHNDETPTLTEAYQTITYTNVAQPVHHKADDIAYFFQDNKVHTLNNTSWTLNVLTLPDNMKIVGGASYGNYLAIVCAPIEMGTTNSVMYLWDRDSSLTTMSSKIDLGMGDTVHVSESEDGGVWITQRTSGISGTASLNNSVSIKYFNGYLETLDITVGMACDYLSSFSLYGNSWEERNVFYFPAKIVTRITSDTRHVIMAAKRIDGKIKFVADQEIPDVSQNINGILSIAGIWYVSYDTAAQSLMAKVTGLYQTATFESEILDEGDTSLKKKLIGVSATTSSMLSSGSYSLYYRKDSETSYTLIFTNAYTSAGSFVTGTRYTIASVGTTDFTTIGASANTIGVEFEATGAGTGTGVAIKDPISHSATNIESSGTNLPEYREIQFKAVSTGGAEITSIPYEIEIIEKRPY